MGQDASFRFEISPLEPEALDTLEQERSGCSRMGPFTHPAIVDASREIYSNVNLVWLKGYSGRTLVFAVGCAKNRLLFHSYLEIWQHPFGPLADPYFNDVGFEPEQFAQAFHRFLIEKRLGALVYRNLPSDSGFAQLRKFWPGFTTDNWHEDRAWLTKRWHLEERLSKRRRKELRRLSNKSGFRHEVLSGEFDWEPAFQAFLELETSGWKGQAGSSLILNAGPRAYAERIIAHHASRGTLRMDLFHSKVDDVERITACLISFIADGRGVIWKIAHDTSLDQLSPGWQLLIAVSQDISAGRDALKIDSLANPDHPLINRLWPERRRMLHGVLPVAGHALVNITLRNLVTSEMRLRHFKRQLKSRAR